MVMNSLLCIPGFVVCLVDWSQDRCDVFIGDAQCLVCVLVIFDSYIF